MGIFEAGPLGLAGSGNVERIGIVLSKPNHTKSLKNQWRASCGIAIYETGGEGGILIGHFLQVAVFQSIMRNRLVDSMFRSRHRNHLLHHDHFGHLDFMF